MRKAPTGQSVTVLVTPEALSAAIVEVSGATYRHLFRALRLQTGAVLRIVDGDGRARSGTVKSIERRKAVVQLGEELDALEPARQVELFVPVLRPSRTSWMVEKSTEIGVAAIRFIGTERSVRTIDRTALKRWRRVAAAAVEQCGRATAPEISGPHGWDEVLGMLGEIPLCWHLSPGGESPVPEPAGQSLAVVVGPEGGWTSAESGALEALGCVSIDLGARTLRAETAAIAGLSRALL